MMGLINMAAKGRNGDTRMAHVTPGEVVIPKEVAALRPDLVAHVANQVRSMGGNPESLTVGRGRINPQTGVEEFATQAEVEKAYQETLGRAPDAGGLAYWMGQNDLGAFKSVAAPELKSNAAAAVNTAYQGNFGREADTAGADYWTGQINSGAIGGISDLNKAMNAGAQGDDIKAHADAAQYSTAWNPDTNPNGQLTYDADKNQWNPLVKKPVTPAPGNYVAAQQGNAVTPTQTMRTVDKPTETVAGQIAGIIAQNSPLSQLAETRSLQRMNERGLINSGMAVGEGQKALYDSALPIATADANVYGNAANINVGTANDFAKTNAATQNQINQFNAAQQNAVWATALSEQNKLLLSSNDTKKGINMQMQQAVQSIQNNYANALAQIMNSTTMDAASKTAAKNQLDLWMNNSISQQGSIAGVNLDAILSGL